MRARVMVIGAGVLMLGACQQQPPLPGNEQAANGVAGRTVFGAPAPRPSATPAPVASVTPRSIMQPDVAKETILPPPLMPISATIGFPEPGTALDAAARAALDKILADPVTASGGPIVLRGSSDSHGSDADNRRTSRKRAQAVATYLEQHGVDKARISVIALGEDRPIAPNANLDGSDNPEGRAKNRRVDIVVTPGETAAKDAGADDAPAPGNDQR